MTGRTPPRPFRPMLRYVVGNAAALLLGLFAAYWALTVRNTGDASVMNFRVADFMEYYSAARLILLGHGGSIYSIAAIGHLQAHLIGMNTAAFGVLAYLYPPHFLLAVVPFALLPYTPAYVLWLAVNCILLALSMYALERYAGLEGRRALAFRAAALVFLPVFMTLGLGQASMVLLVLFTAAFFAMRNGHPALAGAALAAATVKPFYVVPLLLVLLLRCEWRALASYAATMVGLLAIALPVLGGRIYGSYLALSRLMTSWQGRPNHHPLWYDHVAVAPGTFTAEWNHSLAGFVELLLGGPAALWLWAILVAAVLVPVALCALRSPSIDAPLAMAVVAGLLVSPHTLAYDLTLVLIPVAFALRHRRGGLPGLIPFLGVGYVAIAVGYKLSFFVPVQLSVIVMCGLLLWLDATTRRTQRQRCPAAAGDDGSALAIA